MMAVYTTDNFEQLKGFHKIVLDKKDNFYFIYFFKSVIFKCS